MLASCKSAKVSDSEKIFSGKNKAPDQSISGNASGEAKIIATVISIDNTRDSSDVNSPCFKAPCFANIRIEKIEKKGSLFHVPESGEVTAFFIFTLRPTNEDLFPNMGKWYPGLKINDKFEAIIESRPSMNENIRYTIYDYRKIE